MSIQHLEHTLLSAHDPATGRYDAMRIAGALGLTAAEIAGALGRTPQGLKRNPDSEKLQDEMARLVEVIATLRDILDGSMEYVRVWLRSPHPDLGGRPPLRFLVEGKLEVVEGLIHAIETGQPA